jgi:hypothetical protein
MPLENNGFTACVYVDARPLFPPDILNRSYTGGEAGPVIMMEANPDNSRPRLI